MRSQILNLLKQSAKNFISGEELAEKLKVSRTAVWKHIKALRDSGYEIESVPRSGYRLLHSPDLLSAEEVRSVLTTKIIGSDIKYFTVTDSTNVQAKKLAAGGAPDGTIVIAEEQTGGRGRLSRKFFSPRYKGILFSVILRPHILPQQAPKYTLLAAVAIVRAIRKITGVKAGIKWPNDIMYEGKKLVGILTEMNAEMERVNYIIIGMGINVNIPLDELPDEVRDRAGSLSHILGHEVPRLELFGCILAELEHLYITAQSEGFAPIFDLWREYSVTLGQNIRVIGVGTGETYEGTAVDIDSDGALLVKKDGQINRVLAGDVSIRPAGR